MDWKKLFNPVILERGFDYHRNKKAEILNLSADEVNAVVSGSDDYEVNIYFSDGGIDDMYCDCPYASDGNKCKHMAAVLYLLEDLQSHSNPHYTDIESLIAGTSPEQIKKFLINAMRYDTGLEERFIRFIDGENGSINIAEYKSQLKSLIGQYSDNSGFINWKNVSLFINEAVKLLEECTDSLIEWKCYFEAFEIVSYYYDEILITDLDDDGDISYFQNCCLEMLSTIADESDIKTKHRLFNSAFRKLDTKFDYFTELYFDFIKESFDEEEFLEKMLECSDKIISKNNISNYEHEKWILYHMELMDKLGYSDEAIELFCKKYRDIIEVRQFLTDRYLKSGDTDKAIAVLKESLELEKDNMYISEGIHLKLKDIYKQQSDKKNYIKELWTILTETNITEKSVYLELKSLFDGDEWEETREQLYSSMKYQAMLPEYFIEENLTDRLANYVFSNNNTYLIEKYESLLIESYSELVLEAYANELNKAAENTAERSTYKRWADKLRHMKTIKGGIETVDMIIDRWQELYCNRRAMMQEINKVAGERDFGVK
ncbi:SWIM zinc finger family protein [Ruminococcus sp. XPD3002]|uniref:SWIM zinc finger family protein n=1 Tax=Ruminococcus sp. XPD3002 TaxID=1452269 RepID=UPI0009140A67|nr:SWIM zinc finger [Ruminococcus flavefaciens]